MNKNPPKLTLPYNLLAEQIVLGTICLDGSLLPNVLQKLTIESFYIPEHKIIYQTMGQLYEREKDFTFSDLVNYLEEKSLLERIGGLKFLSNLTTKVVTTVNFEIYINLIQEKYVRRLIILLGKYIIDLSYKDEKPLEEILLEVENKVFTLTTKRFTNNVIATTELLGNILIEIQNRFQSPESLSGLSTSFYDLDSLTQGFQKSELIIIAGRPSMGKTAFSLNIGKNITEKYNLPILIFSLEMSKQQLIYRFLSMLTSLNSMRIRAGNLSSIEWEKLKIAIKKLSEMKIFIDDTAFVTLTEIQTKSRQILQQKNKLGLIIIDYLQLMQLGLNIDNRAQELSYITRTLKILARDLNIPIIVLSQLSRSVESRINKRPILSDLRDSGCFGSKQTTNFKNTTIKKIFNIGKKPIYKFKTANFCKQTYTAKHKLLTNFGWTSLDNIEFNQKLQYFYSSNVLVWDYLKFLVYRSIDSTYDIEVKNNSNYLSKNLLSHNSIEQDADIVLMLYREDYYNKDNSDKGLTEIILAKHRNGPIGTINLIFDSKSLQFKNV
jgi:replicative DNA helicase